eukprot:141754-Rhodomonas_salina.3
MKAVCSASPLSFFSKTRSSSTKQCLGFLPRSSLSSAKRGTEYTAFVPAPFSHALSAWSGMGKLASSKCLVGDNRLLPLQPPHRASMIHGMRMVSEAGASSGSDETGKTGWARGSNDSGKESEKGMENKEGTKTGRRAGRQRRREEVQSAK